MAVFSTPITERYFDDYEIGGVYEIGSVTMDEDELIAFAKKYDPQSIHIDRDAALAGPFKGLISSGWHTIALLMRLYVDNYLSANASLASPGVDELRWLKPVRPGDQVRARVTVLERRASKSKPDRGLVFSHLEGFNQDGDLVVSFRGVNMLGVRPAAQTGRN